MTFRCLLLASILLVTNLFLTSLALLADGTVDLTQDPKIQAKFEKISALGRKAWTLDLRSTPQARANEFGTLGTYDFSRPGIYFLQVVIWQPNSSITSEEISFTVK